MTVKEVLENKRNLLDLSWDELDALSHYHVNGKWLKIERPLFTAKWFDYRSLHPAQATFLFAEAFKVAYRNAYADNIDHRSAPYVNPLKRQRQDELVKSSALTDIEISKESNIFELSKQNLTGCWRARQVADACGMPYDVYANEAMKIAVRYWDKPYLPGPILMYTDKVTDRIGARWDQMQETKLLYSKHERYKNENYIGLKDQIEHQEWLITQAGKRTGRDMILAQMVYSEELLTEDKVKQSLGNEVLEKVRSYK